MNSLLRRRTLNEILVSRKQQRKKHSNKIKPEIVEVPTEQKIETLLKKNKITVLRYIEKKHRIRFGVAFGLPLLTWVIEKDKAIVDKHYDSSKRSYFILKGTLSLCERGGLRETCRNQQQRYEEVQQLTQGGIGCIFNPQECHQRCVLMTQGAVLLKIDHCEGELQDLQRDCLLTTQEKQASLKLFPLFFQLGNINKFYAPFFRSQLWSKGDVIYNIGDSADYFYLIVQGEVSFQSQIQVDNPELQGNQHAIAQLTLRNSYPKYLTVNTEIITACNYFGQEELIDLTPRTQTARCVSLTCILMLVPLDKFNKLMFYNDFRDHLTKAAQNRRLQRNNTIASAANLQSYRQETTKTERNDPNRSQVHFNDLNKKIYFSRTQTTEKTSKICLPDRKVRLIHGNPIRLSTHCIAKAENFSMLEVNKTQYESSMKKFRGYSLKERSKRTMNSTIRYEQKGDDNGEACARSLKQIWQVLKLQQVLHEDIERLPIDSAEGKAFYNTYMRRLKHLDHVKSYRPRTMNSSTRAKTDYLEYVQQML